MSSPETTDRWQQAVLWEADGHDISGRPIVKSPVELCVRWEWKYGEARDPQGNLIALAAYVVLDRKVKVGSILWQGKLDDFDATLLGPEEPELCQVVTYNETPDLYNVAIRRTAGLMRYRDSLPGLSGN